MLKKVLIILCCVILSPLRGFALEISEKLLFEKNSLYQYITVIEDAAKKERYIRNKKRDLSQGGIYLNAPDKLLLEYTQIAFISLAFMDREPKEVLFVGLGAGSMPKYFNKHYPDAYNDVVEIDQDIISVAQKYFYFKENEKIKVHAADGRLFIKRTPKKYDMIFLDAYQNDDIPFHLTTVEFLKEVKGKLKDDGVVVSNILSQFKNKFFDSMVMTYRKVFPLLYIFKGGRSHNFIFVATMSNKIKDKGSIIATAKKIHASKKFDIDLERIGESYGYSTEYEWTSAKILTDDFAPVNLYKYQKSESK
jgi:spermidine synthase